MPLPLTSQVTVVTCLSQIIMVRLQRVTFLALHHYLGLTTELFNPVSAPGARAVTGDGATVAPRPEAHASAEGGLVPLRLCCGLPTAGCRGLPLRCLRPPVLDTRCPPAGPSAPSAPPAPPAPRLLPRESVFGPVCGSCAHLAHAELTARPLEVVTS